MALQPVSRFLQSNYSQERLLRDLMDYEAEVTAKLAALQARIETLERQINGNSASTVS
jgi:hypothetical protein